MGENYALELRDISKSFGSVKANDQVNLTLRKSEILAILGENGSGKTTLMNMIYGIYYPDEGHIFVDGKEVKIRSPKDSFNLGIGMVHQHFKLVDVLTAAENIVLGLPGKAKLNMKQICKKSFTRRGRIPNVCKILPTNWLNWIKNFLSLRKTRHWSSNIRKINGT